MNREIKALMRALASARRFVVKEAANPPTDNAKFILWLVAELRWFRAKAIRVEKKLARKQVAR